MPINYIPSMNISANWGDINGTISEQSDLTLLLDSKAEIENMPSFDLLENDLVIIDDNYQEINDFRIELDANSDYLINIKCLIDISTMLYYRLEFPLDSEGWCELENSENPDIQTTASFEIITSNMLQIEMPSVYFSTIASNDINRKDEFNILLKTGINSGELSLQCKKAGLMYPDCIILKNSLITYRKI